MGKAGWTTAELAALHAELMTIAASTSQAIGLEKSAAGVAGPVVASATGVSLAARWWAATRSAAAFLWPRQGAFRAVPAMVEAYRSVYASRWRLMLPIAVPAGLVGALMAERPFGLPVPRALQMGISVLVGTAAAGWLWDAWMRQRLTHGPLDWRPRSWADTLRFLKIGVHASAALILTASALAIGSWFTGSSLFVLVPWTVALVLGSAAIFPVGSLAAADGRTAWESWRLLGNDPVRYALGAVPTLPPCLLALIPTVGLLFDGTLLPGHNLPAAIGAAAVLAAGLIHADYVARVYAHAAGLGP